MSKPVYLSETAYVSLYEIKSHQIDMARISGHTEEQSQKIWHGSYPSFSQCSHRSFIWHGYVAHRSANGHSWLSFP